MKKDHLNIYFAEISKYPILTKEKEIELGIKIQNYMRYKKEGLGVIVPTEHLPKILEYIKEAIKEGEYARSTMIQSNLRLVINIAKRYIDKGLSLDDLIGEGNMGLIRAVEKYDPYHGERFSTYATWWIKQPIKTALKEKTHIIRIPTNSYDHFSEFKKTTKNLAEKLMRDPTNKEIADKMEIPEKRIKKLKDVQLADKRNKRMISLSEVRDNDNRSLIERIVYKTDNNKEEQYSTKDIDSLIDMAIKNPRDREIIKMRFGLNCYEKMTLEKIGEKFNRTKELIRRVEVKCLNKLNEEILRQRKYFSKKQLIPKPL